MVLVGDRGMITQARIDEEIKPAGLDWITALRAPAIRALVDAGALQMSLFDQRDIAVITSPDFPGERLIVCRNGDLARERARKREDLLAATERDLAAIAEAVRRARQPLRGKAEIGLKVGAVLNRHKMAKHFEIAIAEAHFAFSRKADAIAAEAALDGIYVVRTTCRRTRSMMPPTVGAYKSLAQVERAFRSLKTVDFQSRPIFHWTAPRVRAHVFLCMLAYHVEHHMRAKLAPMLYDETDHEAAAALRASIVAKAERSAAAQPSKPQDARQTACRSTASKACSPISPPIPASRQPPPSTKNTSSPSTPGQLRSRARFRIARRKPRTYPVNDPSLATNKREINGLSF